MQPLPIDTILDDVSQAIAGSGALVLKAATGAGKTSRVPPRLLADLPPKSGQVVVVEPRRIAARAAAARVAEELAWELGREVGYRIRYDDRSSAATRLLYVTEGVLLAWLQRDPYLEEVAGVVFDEFHERNLASDLGLAMVERVRRTVREDLRLVVMSATLSSREVASFLGDCPVLESEGRLHPVAVEYLKRPDERPLPQQASAAIARLLAEGSQDAGDVLVFLPGVGEIRRVGEAISPLAASGDVEVHELFGDLPIERQQAALRRSPAGRRRIVLATNVAETSVTVAGVTTVIDTGFERRLELDPATGFDRLELRPISRSSARQRAGRAGREAPGRCLRLWTEAQESQRAESTPAEVRRVDLASPILRLVAWGEAEPLTFPWYEPPDPARAERALELLETLQAITRSEPGRCEATEEGRTMAAVSCHPRLARVLLAAAREGELERGAAVAALLEERDVFSRLATGERAQTCRSDVLERLEAIEALARGRKTPSRLAPARARQVLASAEQLASSLRAAGVVGSRRKPGQRSDELLLRALLAGFPDRVARRRDPAPERGSEASDRAVMVGGRGVRLASSSGVSVAPLFLALDVGRATAAVAPSASGAASAPREALVFLASAIEEEWLDPDLVTVERQVDWHAPSDRVRATEARRYRDLVLDERDVPASKEEIAATLTAAALADPEEFLALGDPELGELLARTATLRAWHPELGLPDWSPPRIAELAAPFCTGRRSASEWRKLKLAPLLLGLLERAQRHALDQLVPAAIELPNGRRARLRYDGAGAQPVLAMRIQELFGVRETPTVDGGRRTVLLHLLAPNQRPQQVTSDLAGFWNGSYEQVRKELQGRYPKHPWPKDPASAEPPSGRRARKG